MKQKYLFRCSAILAVFLLLLAFGIWQGAQAFPLPISRTAFGVLHGAERQNAACFLNAGLTAGSRLSLESGQAVTRGEVAVITAALAVLAAAILSVGLFLSRAKRIRLLKKLALHDRLTGLSNWQALDQHFQSLRSLDGWVYLLFSIPEFRRINNVFGNDVSLQFLRDITAVMKSSLSSEEIAARISENGFAMLLHGDELDGRINSILERLHRIPLTDGNVVYDYLCSYCGCACQLTGEEKSLPRLNRIASTVMDSQPAHHIVSWEWYDKTKSGLAELQDSLIPELSRALRDHEFIPYFQPQYDITTDEIVGAELLARWKHPKHGILLPEIFVPLLEACGCVLELDLIMLEQACRKIQEWLSLGLLPVHLSVNISRLNIHRRDFQERLLATVRQYGVPANLLSLELTETAIFDNSEKILSLARMLKQEGFILAMDDFGTGYSSLNMLREIPVDTIKLDQRLLADSEKSRRGRTILSNIVRMTHELDASLVAEGVENKEQTDLLKETGCRVAQGFYYSKPIPSDKFEELIFHEQV